MPSGDSFESASDLSVIEEQSGTVCVLRLIGELDTTVAWPLAALIEERAAEFPEVVLDLDGLDFIDSTGLTAILAAYDACVACRCRLSATCGSRKVQRVLEIAGLRGVGPFPPAALQTG